MNAPARTRSEFAERIREQVALASRSAIQTGRLLVEAKSALSHGEWLAMVESDLPFGERTAQRLMHIARHPLISNPTHGSDLPASWRTLHELARVPDTVLKAKLAEGAVTPELERSAVERWRREASPPRAAAKPLRAAPAPEPPPRPVPPRPTAPGDLLLDCAEAALAAVHETARGRVLSTQDKGCLRALIRAIETLRNDRLAELRTRQPALPGAR
jgi:hypothetical protein